MKRLIILIIVLATSGLISAQHTVQDRCTWNQLPEVARTATDTAADFTITTTDGVTRNLYNTLDSGRTVFIDLFYTTCTWCQYYAPVIEEVYQEWGAGEGMVEFWGISNNLFDDDSVIDQYKVNYNVSNPCAGPHGGGIQAFTIIVEGQDFLGFPTYCVVCPDRTLYFDACYPPTPACFDPFFEECGATTSIDDQMQLTDKEGILSIYPNPGNDIFYLKIKADKTGPVTLDVFTMSGMIAGSSSLELHNGIQTVPLETSFLPAGVYVLRLLTVDGLVDTQKLRILR